MTPKESNKLPINKSREEAHSAARLKLFKTFFNIQMHCPNAVKVMAAPKTIKFRCGALDTPCNVANCQKIKLSSKI